MRRTVFYDGEDPSTVTGHCPFCGGPEDCQTHFMDFDDSPEGLFLMYEDSEVDVQVPEPDMLSSTPAPGPSNERFTSVAGVVPASAWKTLKCSTYEDVVTVCAIHGWSDFVESFIEKGWTADKICQALTAASKQRSC